MAYQFLEHLDKPFDSVKKPSPYVYEVRDFSLATEPQTTLQKQDFGYSGDDGMILLKDPLHTDFVIPPDVGGNNLPKVFMGKDPKKLE